MSITFTIARESTLTGYQAMCYAYGPESKWMSAVHPTREDAAQAHATEHAGNVDCDDEVSCFAAFDTDTDPQLNMSNTNAATLLQTLGLYPEEGEMPWCGTVDADDLIGRVLLAFALQPQDEGIPATSTRTAAGGEFVDCGRPPGYVQQRLAQLHDLAEHAKAHGYAVSWA